MATIKGSLKNSYGQIKFKFNVIIENSPPTLVQGAPQDCRVLVGTEISIPLGDTYDRENSNDIILETFESTKKSLPQFISFNKEAKEYSISPTNKDKIGKYSIVIRLTDCYKAQKTYSFFVEIYKLDIFSKESAAESMKVLKVQASVQILKI